MSGSTRPSMKSVQRSLLVGILAGLILGCGIGAALVGIYIRTDPPVYEGGAYPSEMTENYQDHYTAMAIDSYIVNRNVDLARERLKTFSPEEKIESLGRWSANYVANGQAVEAQLVNELAAALMAAENWTDETVSAVAQELTAEYQGDTARVQAITTFAAQLGQVPQGQPPPAAEEPVEQPAEEPAAAPPPAEPAPGGGIPWRTVAACLIVLFLVLVVALLVVRLLGRRKKAPAKKEVVWEGEGPAPIKQWTGTYRIGQDSYDEFFTIETDDGDFLGESGIGILEAIPDSQPKQVIAFDVGLFDKTDITTLSRVLMNEYAYNDETVRAKVEANPQAEAVLAEPGKEFTLETSAMRVVAKVDDMQLQHTEDNKAYFESLTVTLTVFVREGADLKIGTMDVPDEYK